MSRLWKTLPICHSNKCGHWGADDQGRVGCLLIDGCPNRIRDHVMIGGGCLHPVDPLFGSTDRYERLPEDRKTKVREGDVSL